MLFESQSVTNNWAQNLSIVLAAYNNLTFCNLQEENYEDELDALKKDSEIPMEDLLETLPEKILKRITGEANSDSDTDVDDGNSEEENSDEESEQEEDCLLYTSPSPRDS